MLAVVSSKGRTLPGSTGHNLPGNVVHWGNCRRAPQEWLTPPKMFAATDQHFGIGRGSDSVAFGHGVGILQLGFKKWTRPSAAICLAAIEGN